MPDPQQPPITQAPKTLHDRAADMVRDRAAAERSRLLESSTLMASQLDQMELPRLPEDQFVGFFLPYFAGEIPLNDGKNAQAHWISIAKSPSSEVSVVDNAGNELFRVPPLFDTTIINPSRPLDRTRGFGTIVQLAAQYGSQIPVRGERYLMQGLVEKQQEIRAKSEVHDAYRQRWLEIFKRYGKLRAADAGTAAKTNSDEIGDDDLQFD